MKRSRIVVVALIVLTCMAMLAMTSYRSENDMARDEVMAHIQKSYINGAFNDLDTKSMKSGFHSEFAIFSAKGEELQKYEIADWIAGIEKRKAKPGFDPAAQKWEHKFKSVDVTSGSAAAKIELYKDEKHVYTDYLHLLKFDSGWKIVGKVYHDHRN